MIRNLYEQNIIIYIFAGLCGLGILIRFIVNLVYKHLVKQSNNPGETKNKMIKHMKLKFETCFKLKIGVNNVDTFVDKGILQYRFCGILLSTWDNFGGQVLFLTLLLVPISTVFGVIYKCGQENVLLSGAAGIVASAILIFVDKSINLSAKKKMIRLNLLDFLENFCKVRLEQEAYQPELIEQYRREYLQVAEAGKQISAASDSRQSDEPKDELNRRREARRKKEEERKLQAKRREEEQRRNEQIRREEEKRRLEERKQLAAKRREEELRRLQEERKALEEKRAEMKRQALEKKIDLEKKKQQEQDTEEKIHNLEEAFGPPVDKASMNTVMQEQNESQGNSDREDNLYTNEEPNAPSSKLSNVVEHSFEEIAAERERAEEDMNKSAAVQAELGQKEKGISKKSSVGKLKLQGMSPQEERLIEDVLKEFFA
ncbi:hypothetical protein H0486_00290 [Lachnospiraceae bacterium MD1]|uniref:Uncharacterized protein n=1 Tax=Variimorphobacter saccharofermentans TaxID=2755051 RepID=A0A839JUK9_9FIRM|nr:hypothetical protein [Variimorphobacter saccharofermentans]MBB2181333.1 hypothetical protein [Variimorphobacter saccharofermentans]